jgi:integrase
VRINYIADSGEAKQLTRVAYGSRVAKDLELRLHEKIKIKDEKPMRKITVQDLFDEFIEIKACELRKTSTERIKRAYTKHIAPTFNNYRIDRVTVKDIQDWKLSIEKKGLAFNTKKVLFKCFCSIMSHAVKMEYLQKNPLLKIGNFKDTLNIKCEMNIYTLEEFKRFISTAKELAEEKERLHNDVSEWNYYVFFNIAFYTGLRKGEIHALKWSDINETFNG